MIHDGRKCPLCGDFDLGDWCNNCNMPTVPMFESESKSLVEHDAYSQEEIDSRGYTIELPDGYNNHTAKFWLVPMEEGETSVKLRCAEPNKQFMHRWVTRKDYEAALKAADFEKGGSNES